MAARGTRKLQSVSHQSNWDTSRKKPKPLAKQEIREMGETGQAEDIRACIKAEREKTEQKKSTSREKAGVTQAVEE